MMAHAGSERSGGRWFGFIRNIVFAANVTAIAHFASLQDLGDPSLRSALRSLRPGRNGRGLVGVPACW